MALANAIEIAQALLSFTSYIRRHFFSRFFEDKVLNYAKSGIRRNSDALLYQMQNKVKYTFTTCNIRLKTFDSYL